MSERTTSPRQTAVLWAAALAVLAVAVGMQAFAGRLLRADLTITEARRQVLQCESQSSTWEPAQWQALQADLEQGLALTPTDPVKHDLLSQLHACHGTQLWGDEGLRRYYYGLARQHGDASLRLRPGHATTLTRLAVAIQASGGTQDEVDAVWADALQQGPHVQANHPALAYVVLSNWDGARPEMQAWVRSLLAQPLAGEGRWLLDMVQAMGMQDKLQ